MIRRLVLPLALLVAAGPSSAEIICEDALYTCITQGQSVVDGFELVDYCQEFAGTQSCRDTEPLNECSAVEVSLNCTQTSSECILYQNGECRQTRFKYSCLNENADMSPAILERTEFGPIQEEIIDTCEAYSDNERCELVDTVTTEGEETRVINRYPFHRSWWVRTRQYSCLAPGEGDNTCGPLESDPTCHLVGDNCLVEDENGVCSNRDYHYQCGVQSGDMQTSCEPINVCVGDTCFDVEPEPSDDFPTAASWLHVLAEMQRDFRGSGFDDYTDMEFFKGTQTHCRKLVLSRLRSGL